jgi:curved DNA-binding protein CbpA
VAQRTLYEVMMLHPSATPEVITAVYRQLAKQHHPDHAGQASQQRMAEINEAFAILSNAEKRARYDEINGLAPEKPSSAATNGSSPSGATSAKPAASARPAAAARSAASATNGSSPGPSSSSAASFSRQSAPGATNLKYEDGRWSVRDATEPTAAPSQYGEAGPPPRHPPAKGRVISFGRYRGWTVSQVASYDRNYIEWLSRTMAGRTYQAELERVLSQPAR